MGGKSSGLLPDSYALGAAPAIHTVGRVLPMRRITVNLAAVQVII